MSTVDLVQAHVMGQMLRGNLAPDTWVRQDALAEQLGVSKIPVREALHRLAANGLLRFETNRGVVVPRLSAEEAEENYALRLAVEVRLLEQALPRLSPVDLAEAAMALEPGTTSITESNWHFHRALYRPSGWHRGLAMVEILNVAVAPYVMLYTHGLGGRDHSDSEHHDLLDACRVEDRETAVELLARHLSSAQTALVAFLDPTPSDTPTPHRLDTDR